MSIFPDLKAQVRARLVPHYKVSDISRRARCGLYQCIINHIIIRPNKIWCKKFRSLRFWWILANIRHPFCQSSESFPFKAWRLVSALPIGKEHRSIGLSVSSNLFICIKDGLALHSVLEKGTESKTSQELWILSLVTLWLPIILSMS